MKAKAILYRANNMDFLRVESNPRSRPYSLAYLEKLAGFKLVPHAPKILLQYGFIRVCKDDNSYRARVN